MIILKAYNKNLTSNAKYSYLSTNYVSGVSSIVLINSIGFAADDYLLLGEFGSETAEIVQVDTVTAATHTIALKAATKFSHAESTKVTIIRYNQVKYYQTAATTFSSSENPLGTENVQADNLYTIYQDTVNTTGYGWFLFFNSTTLKATSVSNYIPYGNFGVNTAKRIIDSFLRSLNQKDSKLISIEDALSWLSEAYSIIQGELNLINKEFKAQDKYELTVSSGTAEYAFNTNASEILSVYSDSDNKPIDYIPWEEVDSWGYNTGNPIKYYVRGNYIGFSPTPTSEADYIIKFLAKTAEITSFTDEVTLPDNEFYCLKDYMMFRAATPLKRQDGDVYYKLFIDAVNRMKLKAVKRHSGKDSWEIDRYSNI